MARLVLDTLFCEVVTFVVPSADFRVCACALSQEEVLRSAMAYVGLELIDYGSWFARPDPRGALMQVLAYSKAYRERAERATAAR